MFVLECSGRASVTGGRLLNEAAAALPAAGRGEDEVEVMLDKGTTMAGEPSSRKGRQSSTSAKVLETLAETAFEGTYSVSRLGLQHLPRRTRSTKVARRATAEGTTRRAS